VTGNDDSPTLPPAWNHDLGYDLRAELLWLKNVPVKTLRRQPYPLLMSALRRAIAAEEKLAKFQYNRGWVDDYQI
jgi:hypothetical protein